LPVKRKSRSGLLAIFLVVGLPLLSYPLSWLPKSWIHFRFNLILPVPEIVFALGLFVFAGILLRAWFAKSSPEIEPDFFLPRPVFLPLLAVAASTLLSTRFSAHSYLGLGVLPQLAGNLTIFLLATMVPRERMRDVCRWWVITALFVAANGLIRGGSGPDVVSSFGNRNFFAAYLAASVIIAIGIGKAWSLCGTLPLLVSMWFCHSRGAWLSLGIVITLWVLVFGNKGLRSRTARALAVLLILATASLLARPYASRLWQSDVRPMIWQATLRMIAARPLVGHGLGSYVAEYPQYRLPEYFLRPKATNVTNHAHSELLETAAEQGLIGFAATLWLWITALGGGFRCFRQQPSAERRLMMSLLGATALLMLHGLVDIDLRYPPNQGLFWLLLGLLAGLGFPPVTRRQLMVRSTLGRLCTSVASLALGFWVLVGAIIDPMMADWLDRRARLAEERGDLETTVRTATQALRLQPFRLSTHYLLAGALSKLSTPQAHQAAIEQCLRIEEIVPDYADVTYNLGQMYLADGRASEALPYLRRAAQANPYDARRHIALSAGLRETGHADEAQRQMEQALQLQPTNQDIRELQLQP
jgi:tetratricopeptide (TPR) repeat protein